MYLNIALGIAIGVPIGHSRLLPYLREWVLYLYARAQSGTWFTESQQCAGCGRKAHVMRHCPGVEVAGDDSGYRCIPCANGRQQ